MTGEEVVAVLGVYPFSFLPNGYRVCSVFYIACCDIYCDVIGSKIQESTSMVYVTKESSHTRHRNDVFLGRCYDIHTIHLVSIFIFI